MLRKSKMKRRNTEPSIASSESKSVIDKSSCEKSSISERSDE